MKKKGKLISVTAALCLSVVASCSLTNLNAVWMDPQYQGGKLTPHVFGKYRFLSQFLTDPELPTLKIHNVIL